MNRIKILNLLANTADGVFAIGADHKIVFWNKAAKRILGYSAKEVLGKYCHDVIAGTDNKGNLLCSVRCNVMKTVTRGGIPGIL